MIGMINIEVTWITLEDTSNWREHHKELKKFFKRAAKRTFRVPVEIVDLYAEDHEKMYVKIALMEDPGMSLRDLNFKVFDDLLMMVDEYFYKKAQGYADIQELAMFRHHNEIDPQTVEVSVKANPEIGGQQRLFAAETKRHLVKMGYARPELRKHLRPILDSLEEGE